jgi:pimeloyl-ACP methyl ester carboxylesterase
METVLDSRYVPPPSIGLAVTEAHRALAEFASLMYTRRFLERLPRGDGHGVILLPGFLGDDGYNAPLRRHLNKIGYHAVGWAQGRNLGPRGDLLERTLEYVQDLARETGGKVSLVGHSLGGIYARELAKEAADDVRQVISLGSPFGEGRDTGAYPRRLFSTLNPDEDITIEQHALTEPPPMPTTAVFSKEDGVVNWLTCYQEGRHEHVQNIQVWGSHCGMTINPMVWFLLAERLAQPEDNWRPFRSNTWRRLFYPKIS